MGSEIDGTLDFQAGGAAAINAELTFSISLNLPAACLGGPAGMNITCAQFQETANRDPSGGPTNWTCQATEDGGCACEAGRMQGAINHMGTWAVDGNVVTLSGLDGGPMVDNGPNGPHSFCIDGDQAALREVTDEPSPVILLERQQ